MSDGSEGILRRTLAHRGVRLPLVVILVLVAAAVLAPWIARFSPVAQLDIVALKNQAPSTAHFFGTDRFSRDVFSRVLYGARISLAVATLAVFLSVVIGTPYGMIAGYWGGMVDAVLMRLLDAFLSIPRVLLLIAILSLWNPVPLWGVIVLLGATGWFRVSRLVRAETLSARQREYVLAARALGASDRRILGRHLLPNVVGPVVVAATLAIGDTIMLEAGLTFLGIGTREPTASWGSMFQDSSDAFAAAWWVALFPGLAIVITSLAFNALGDALRDVLDPRQLDATPGANIGPSVPTVGSMSGHAVVHQSRGTSLSGGTDRPMSLHDIEPSSRD